MKFALCNEMYVNRPVAQVIRHAAELGYDGIELAPFTLTDHIESWPPSAQRELARCATDSGMEIVGLHWLLAGPKGLHLVSGDPSIRRRTREFFRKLIEIAVNTGGRILTLGSPRQRSFAEVESAETAAGRVVEFFRDLAPELESAGVTVALEPLEPQYTNFLTRTVEAVAVAEAVGSPAIGITLDTHFMRWESAKHGVGYLEAMRTAGKRLVHLHIQDDNLLAPGTGKADFTEYVAALREIGWERYISFEALNVSQEGMGEQLAAACMDFFRRHVVPLR